MVMAKVMTAKADLPSTVAAMLAFTQSAAATVGVLAVARTPEGLLNTPSVELVLVCIVTSAVAVVLALGCVHILTGRSSRLTVVGSVASLLISAYWSLLRGPPEAFPDVAVAYAVLPALTLGSLAVSRVLTARRAKRPKPMVAVDEGEPEPDSEPQPGETARPWEPGGGQTEDDSTPDDYELERDYDPERDYEPAQGYDLAQDYEPAHEETERPWEFARDGKEDGSESAPRRDMLVE